MRSSSLSKKRRIWSQKVFSFIRQLYTETGVNCIISKTHFLPQKIREDSLPMGRETSLIFHSHAAALSVERDGEAMRFVAEAHERLKRRPLGNLAVHIGSLPRRALRDSDNG